MTLLMHITWSYYFVLIFQWLDHILMIISEDDVDDMHRELLDCKTYIQHICGQNINLYVFLYFYLLLYT